MGRHKSQLCSESEARIFNLQPWLEQRFNPGWTTAGDSQEPRVKSGTSGSQSGFLAIMLTANYRLLWILLEILIMLVLCFSCCTVSDSPRLGTDAETYTQVIIAAHGYPNGVLQLSNETVKVPANYPGPLLYIVRNAGLFGSVSGCIHLVDRRNYLQKS
jgi:hypothetical protein